MIKKIKAVTGVVAALAMIYAVGLIGSDDFYTIELHQYHAMDWKGLLICTALCIPFILVAWFDEHYYFGKEED